MRKTTVLLLISSLVWLAGCGGTKAPNQAAPTAQPATPAAQPAAQSAAPKAQPVTLKLAHLNAVGHPTDQGAQKFVELVQQKSGGSVKIEVFPASQLGTEKQHAEGVKLGTIDIISISAGGLAIFLPQLGVFDAGYIWRDDQHQYRVTQGPIGQEITDKMLQTAGVRILGYYYQGFRHLTTRNKVVKSPADLQGLKIRTPDVKVFAETMKAMGANPTPIPFNELFTVLQSGVVEGQENPLPTILASKFFEVQKSVHLTGHMASVGVYGMHEKTFQKLAPEQRKAMEDAMKETVEYHRKIIKEQEAKTLDELKKLGMQVVEVDRDAFQKRVQAALPAVFEKDWGAGLYEKIQATQ